MHNDDLDFYGHTHRRLPKGLIAALLLLVFLVGAMAWADSDLAADYESARIVAEECAKQPELCQTKTVARPRKKKIECGVRSVANHTASLSVIALVANQKPEVSRGV